jgi:hypothetical protein
MTLKPLFAIPTIGGAEQGPAGGRSPRAAGAGGALEVKKV